MGMFWWIPALVPLIGVLIILVSPLWPIAAWEGATNPRQITENWKKFGIYAGVNLVICMLIALCCWGGATSKQNFKEVWNYRYVGIKHEMQWTTHETRTETYYTGSGKNRQSHTKTVHYTAKHGPYWKAQDEYGEWDSISEDTYNTWRKVWKNEEQTGIHEGSSAFLDRSIDGPIYECRWTKKFETIYPATSVHSYVNKIRVSNSVLKYGNPTKDLIAKYPRPVDVGNRSPFVSYCGMGISGDDMMFLRRVNADLGFTKQIHSILVAFDAKCDRGVIEDVLKAWAGPNKNELVTFISLDGNKVRWVDVHSWMDNTTLHAVLRDELMGEPFSVRRYGTLLREYAPKLWQRKHFTPINAYLRVSIHPGWIIFGFLLAIIVAIVSYVVIEIQFEGGLMPHTWRNEWGGPMGSYNIKPLRGFRGRF